MEIDPIVLVGLGVIAFFSAVIGGLAGLGSAIIMIPALTFAVGIREAVPITTIAVMMQTWSRIWVNRALIDRSVVKWFFIGALPTSVVGAAAFASLPADLLQKGFAIFLLLIVAFRHTPLASRGMRMSARSFVGVGAGQGFLSSLFGGAGPFGASFFLAYGLRRGAFVGTMASGMSIINVVKIGVYGSFDLLDTQALLLAGALGLVMVGGAYLGGALVNRVSDKAFVYIVEIVIVGAAISLLVR